MEDHTELYINTEKSRVEQRKAEDARNSEEQGTREEIRVHTCNRCISTFLFFFNTEKRQ